MNIDTAEGREGYRAHGGEPDRGYCTAAEPETYEGGGLCRERHGPPSSSVVRAPAWRPMVPWLGRTTLAELRQSQGQSRGIFMGGSMRGWRKSGRRDRLGGERRWC